MLNTWRAQGVAGFEGGAGAGAGVRMVTLVPGSAGAQMPVLNAAGQGMPMPMCLPALHAPEQGAPVGCFLSRFNSVWPAGNLSFQPELGPQARAAQWQVEQGLAMSFHSNSSRSHVCPLQQQQQQQQEPFVLPPVKSSPPELPAVIVDDEDEESIWAMFSFKITPCEKMFVHDWKACCFSHDGETAKRRLPLVLDPDGGFKLAYSSAHCLDFKRHKICRRGDSCPYSHGAWEVGLHPSSFRQQMCTYGSACTRRVCFFAHQPSHLRTEAAKKFVSLELSQFGVSDLGASDGRQESGRWLQPPPASQPPQKLQHELGVECGVVDDEELELLSVTLAASRLVEESQRKMRAPPSTPIRERQLRTPHAWRASNSSKDIAGRHNKKRTSALNFHAGEFVPSAARASSGAPNLDWVHDLVEESDRWQ